MPANKQTNLVTLCVFPPLWDLDDLTSEVSASTEATHRGEAFSFSRLAKKEGSAWLQRADSNVCSSDWLKMDKSSLKQKQLKKKCWIHLLLLRLMSRLRLTYSTHTLSHTMPKFFEKLPSLDYWGPEIEFTYFHCRSNCWKKLPKPIGRMPWISQ